MAACGAGSERDAPPPESVTGKTSEAIYGGTQDNDSNPSVLALKVGNQSPFELCTSSLIAPNVVLTAFHCVAANLTTAVGCDENGNSTNGAQLGADVDPTTLHVFIGGAPDLRNGTPAANGKAIFHVQSNSLCNGDLALVVLDQNITQVPFLKVRLKTGTPAGETFRAVGFGMNDQSVPIGTRFYKNDVGILAIGKAISASNTALGTNEFEVGVSMCQGDSGGPAINQTTGAVVGVVSRGGDCTDAFGHIYTNISGFASVFNAAFAAAGTQPYEEMDTTPPPPPSGGAGGSGGSAGSGGAGGGGGSGGAGGAGGMNNAQGNHPVNLHSGTGNNCSASPVGSTDVFGGVAVLLAVVVISLRRSNIGGSQTSEPLKS